MTDTIDGFVCPLVQHVGKVGGQGLALHLGPGGQPLQFCQLGQQLAPLPDDGFRRHLGDARMELVVNAGENLPVVWMMGEGHQIQHVPDHPMGEEAALHLAAAIPDALAVQKVQNRQSAVVVPIEDSGLPITVGGQPGQVLVLIRPVIGPQFTNGRTLPVGGGHIFVPAVAVLLDELPGRRHNVGGGAVVLLHEQDSCPGIDPFKRHKGGGIGRPEAVDALVLISHHEEVGPFPCQQSDDAVLDLGGILGLVHTEIGVSPLEVFQNFRILSKDLGRIDHLVIVVHPAILAKGSTVVPVDPGHRQVVRLVLVDLLFGQLHIFDISYGRPKGFDGAFRGKLSCGLSAELSHQSGELSLIGDELKGLTTHGLLVMADDSGRDPVDGAKLQPSGHLLPKKGSKTSRHVTGGGYGVSHSQNILREDILAEQHIPQPEDEDGGFSAPRHRQKEDRAVHSPDGHLLLAIQRNLDPVPEFLPGHLGPPSVRPL